MAWLDESDVVVAEVTMPSLGVGYELGEAVRAHKPTLCFFRADSEGRLSAMVSGSPGIKVVTYKTEENIKTRLICFSPKEVSRENFFKFLPFAASEK